MPTSAQLPFQPVRDELYSSRELLTAFDPAEPQSMAQIPEFRTFRLFRDQRTRDAS